MDHSEEMDGLVRRYSCRDTYYLVTETDLERIDGLISSLDLAISEILQRRAVRYDPFAETPAQNEFYDRVYAEIEKNPR